MAELVYLLCAATSTACAVLLFRHSYRQRGSNLLFWSGLCFAGLAFNNILLVVDLVVAPEVDLGLLRSAVSLAAMMVLLFGLVWESR